ncbi:MAG: hypothetical protein GY722_07360 [bacterium]|nr:hypothetical protein [bacterium]
MAASESRDRLEAAKRRNQRRLALPEVSEGVRQALGSTIDVELRLMDLEESASFEQAFHTRLDEVRGTNALEVTRTRDRGRLREEVQRAFAASPELEYLVLLCRWRQVGALRLTGQELESGLLSLLEWDGDTVYGGTMNLDTVFLFDVTRGDAQTNTYEVLHWTANS